MVDTDAQGLVLLLEQLNQWFKCFGDALTDGRYLLGAEFGAIWVGLVEHKQTWVDPHLVDVLGHLQGNLHAVVVHVGHQWHRLIGVF